MMVEHSQWKYICLCSAGEDSEMVMPDNRSLANHVFELRLSPGSSSALRDVSLSGCKARDLCGSFQVDICRPEIESVYVT